MHPQCVFHGGEQPFEWSVALKSTDRKENLRCGGSQSHERQVGHCRVPDLAVNRFEHSIMAQTKRVHQSSLKCITLYYIFQFYHKILKDVFSTDHVSYPPKNAENLLILLLLLIAALVAIGSRLRSRCGGTAPARYPAPA